MKISGIKTVSFKAAPTKKGLEEIDKLCKEGETLMHPNGTDTIFDFYHWSAPSCEKYDTGEGKITSDKSIEFIKTMKPYIGFNTEKIYPVGKFASKGAARAGYYCPYERGSFTIGEDNIDFKKLTENEYGNILDKKDVEKFAEKNLNTRESADRINYENEIGHDMEYPLNKLLNKAYENFKELNENNPLKLEFEEYKKKPVVERYDRLALWHFVAEYDTDLFLNFNKSPEKQKRFENYKKEYKDEIEFYKFGQFLAYKQFMEAKKEYNNAGVKIMGDVQIKNSQEEYWAYRDAFDENRTVGWNSPFMRYEDMDDTTSESYKFLKGKFAFAAEIFDSFRLDVGTSYDEGYFMERKANGEWNDKNWHHYENNEKILKIIEETCKEVKGEDYDLSQITYEAEGDAGKFLYWKPEEVENCNLKGAPIKKALKVTENKARKMPPQAVMPSPKGPLSKRSLILSTQYERSANTLNNKWDVGYGNHDFYTNVAGLDEYNIIMGTANHDGTPTRMIAENQGERFEQARKDATPVLSDVLNISKRYLRNVKTFFKAKMAEIQLAPRRFYYFVDVFGKKEAINDFHGDEPVKERFRYRLTNDYEEMYNKELQQNNAFNRPEALAMALRAKGLNKTNPVLYEKLKYSGKYLRKQGVLTSKKAEIVAQRQGYDELIKNLEKIEIDYKNQN